MTDQNLMNPSNKLGLIPKKEPLSIQKNESSYEGLFRQLTDLGHGDIIIRPNCKFCNHPLRASAEELFEQRNRTSYIVVERLFREYEASHPEADKMSTKCVRNHLKKHYLQQEKQLYLREYGRRLSDMMNYKISQDQQFELLNKALEDKFLEIGASPDLDPIKQADTMTKLSKSILEIIAVQAKMRGDLEVINVLTDKFVNVWQHVISVQESAETKQELLLALDAFQEIVQGVTIEDG